jgi:hypothetical protein
MSLTIPVPLTVEEQAALEAQAKALGTSVDLLLRKAVLQVISSEQGGKQPLAASEFDRALEEIADLIPEDLPALSDQAISRESIYTREDEWNRNPR